MQRHEESDVNVGAVFRFGAGLTAVTAVVLVLMRLLFGYFDRREAGQTERTYPFAAGQELRQPPEPRLQIAPREDLREVRAREDALLNGYQWVDKAAGVVRIPIADAMRLTVERGLPVRGAKP
jgi:hypothetical protein